MTHSSSFSLSRRRALLATTALIAAPLLCAPQSALAACIANGTTTVTVDCAASTTTTNTTNTASTNTTTSDSTQSFDANISGTVHTGVTIDGAGLDLKATGTSPHSIDMTNSGVVSITSAGVTTSAMQIDGNGGTITYGGAGTVIGGANNAGVDLSNTGAAGTGNIVFNGTGAVSSGSSSGIFAQTTLGGTITLNIANNVTGSGVFFGAVTAFGVNGLTTVNMTAGTVTGGPAGIEAISSGTGGIVVNMTGGSIGSSAAAVGGNSGIDASSSGTAGDVTVTGAAIFAQRTGISAKITNAASTGNVLVNANGAILVTTTPTLPNQGPIYAANAGSGSVTVNVNAPITALVTDVTGVVASGTGSGAVTVNVAADINAGTDSFSRGVVAGASNGQTKINMTAGTIHTAGNGLQATSLGTGNIIVNMTGGQIGTSAAPVGGNGIAAANVSGGSGAITITAGTIYATSTGIQSSIGNASNASNTVVAANGAIQAGATGISVSTQGSGALQVTTNGSVVGGTGILFGGGTNNLLTNAATGTITPTAGFNGFAVQAPNGNVTISNAGTMTGKIDLGIPGNAFTNETTGVFNSGVSVVLGGTNTFTNKGSYAPGGTGVIIPTTISGSFVQTSTGKYLVDVSPIASDKTIVLGTASLAGAVQANFIAGSYVAKSYTILTSNARTGTFASLGTNNLPAGFTASLSYTATDAKLDLTASLGGGGGGGGSGGGSSGGGSAGGTSGLVGGELAVATALNSYFNAGNALPSQFVTVFGLTGNSLANGLSQLSGEVTTGAAPAGFAMTGQFLGLMLDPFLETRAGDGQANGPALGFAPERPLPSAVASAYDAVGSVTAREQVERRWGVWGAAYGAQGRRDGDPASGTHSLDARDGGFAAGIDYRLTRDTIIGVALSGGFMGWNLDSLGTGRGDTVQGGVYSATRFGNGYVSAAFAYGRHDMSTDRTVMLPGVADRLTADFAAQDYGGRIESGYRFALSTYGITPYAAAQAQAFHTPAYAEHDVSGLSGFALNYADQTTTQVRSELGSRFDARFVSDGGALLILRGRAAWLHDFSNATAVPASFQVLPGSGFTVSGVAPVRDAALISAGGELRLTDGITLAAKFDGEFSGRGNAYGGTGSIRYGW